MKYKGFSTLELIISVSIISIIFSIIYINISFTSKDFDDAVFILKSDLREYLVKSSNYQSKYKISFEKNGYNVYRKSKLEDKVRFGKDIYLLSSQNGIDYSYTSRNGAPSKGITIYIFDKKYEKLERITMMLGSGRVISYKDTYKDKKSIIDGYMSR